MKSTTSFLFAVVFICISLTARAITPGVIYGSDDRKDYYEVTQQPTLQRADATVALIRNSGLKSNGDQVDIYTRPYGADKGLCPQEPFYHQETAAFCSGFLVTPDTVITAGHCINSQEACLNTSFVFDFKLDQPGQTWIRQVPLKRVFSCARLIHSQAVPDGADFAVIRLSEPVTHVAPLTLRNLSTVTVGQSLIVMGYPSGLPLKISGNAHVRTVQKDFFQANLDTYAGNSGSAVFNGETGEVEGVLVRGERDFDLKDGCKVSKQCKDDECRGEDVTRIDQVLPYLTN